MRSRIAKTQLVVALIAFPAFADDSSNQQQSLINTYNTNSVGSDESLRSSSVYAMQALMDLANGKIPGAVKNGYGAYGKYRNSENLDRLKDETAAIANSMGSVGSAPVLSTARTDTTFRRLDTSFLHQGEAGKVADEFEKETGMKRETFLTQMAAVSEQKIKRSDPMMIDKAFSRFESFLQKIPNQDFRKNAEKSIAMVPDTMRRGMVAQAVQKLAGMIADAGSGASPMDSTITDLTKNKLAASNSSNSGTGGPLASAVSGTGAAAGDKDDKNKTPDGNASRDPASAGTGTLSMAPSGPDFAINGGSGKNGAEGAVAAALAAQGLDSQSEGVSIFQQVSKRYRILTPLFSKAP